MKNLKSEDLAKFMDVGATVSFNATSSSSKSVSTAMGFAGSKGVVFRIKGKTGVDIATMSHFKNEKEVVLRKDAKFKIVSAKKYEKMSHATTSGKVKKAPGSSIYDVHVIDLEEI
jgi:hypothetical protein